MATLARRLFKVALFCVLFRISLAYVHPPPPTESDRVAWLNAANQLGISDPDDLFVPLLLIVNLFVAALLYMAIMKLWRWYRSK
ncbi:hypothetical protein F3J20_26700 [Paraburkholderia sp. Cy-641]|nr:MULTISPECIES: hypothetical protein [unclassified Paraburkholderia]NIF80931.1 hypothetical protein [Paraburkholderia sp. Cy-641]